MTQQTAMLILNLIPLAEKMIFEIGGKLYEMNTKGLTTEELNKALEESKNWPKLSFVSPVKD